GSRVAWAVVAILTLPWYAEYSVASAAAPARHHPEERGRESRVERVANPVAEQVEGEHGDRDGETREEHEPPRRDEVRDRVGQHVAPRRRGGRDADAEEAERGLDDDGDTEVRRGQHEVGRDTLGQHVERHDP